MSILDKKIKFLLLILFNSLFSVSAPPHLYEVEQPDGTKIPVRMFGHEYYSWMESEDGYVIDWIKDEERLGWYYCDLDSDGRYYTTHMLVTYPTSIHLDIQKKIRETFPKVRELGHYELHTAISHSANLDRSSSTTIKPLILLADFSSLPPNMPDRDHSKDDFQHLLFDTNLNPAATNLPSTYEMSVRDYFNEISNGKLEIIGDGASIVDWITVSQSYSYYADGARGTGQGENGITRSAAALVVEMAMDIESNIDFSNFDGNGDGDVDLVILIVEGWGNGDNDQFWPHMSMIQTGVAGISTINSDAPTNNDGFFSLDGVAIKKYIVIPEQFHMNYYDVEQNDIHPIGTICHEMGHVLGLPDLYDTSDNSAAGIGEWGLMGAGNWQRQTSPAYMGAWSRYHLGFIEPIILEDIINPIEKSLLPAETGGVENAAMILPMDSNIPQEYLILENRQKLGADQYLEKSGLLIWHVDETITDMYPAINSVNVNPDFYGVNLLQADGEGALYIPEDLAGAGSADSKDPFPGTLGVTELIDISTYSYDRDADGDVDAGRDSGIEIINIVENSEDLIYFQIINPNKQGKMLGYEGGYGTVAYPNSSSSLQWAGIRITASDSALLSGIETVFPPSNWSWNVTDYTLNIWEGWSNNKPESLLYRFDGSVQWNPEVHRDGGWAFISLIDAPIIWNKGDIYYVEINFNGTGGIYPLGADFYFNSSNNNFSYYRGDTDEECILLDDALEWNIRAVLSGSDDLELLSIEISEIPQQNSIYSNYPNPFNPVTTLPIYLVNPSAVSYYVVDLQGRQIIQKDFPLLNAGYHEFDINMSHVSSGVYLYQFTINDRAYTPSKMVLLK